MSNETGSGYLEGQLLIAMPTMGDPRFERTVIYLCAHSDQGAMGLVVNKLVDHITFEGLLEQLNIEAQVANDVNVHFGGPVETGRGFVLHSADYFVENSTLPIDENISLTATLEILKAIAAGDGPQNSLLALGYAGWAPGQLESEIHANGWLHCPAMPDVVFDADIDAKYDRALKLIGIDPGRLASEAGHA